MADPVSLTMVGISLAAGVAGTTTAMAGAKYSAAAKSNQFMYQSGVAEINKKIAQQNADYTRMVGEREAQRKGMEGRTNVGMAKVAQGASNLSVHGKSAEAVRDSIIDISRHDQTVIRSNAARRAYGYEVEGFQAETQSGLYKMGAETSQVEGDLKATASLISGVGNVASKWYAAAPAFGTSGGSFMPSKAFMANEWGW